MSVPLAFTHDDHWVKGQEVMRAWVHLYRTLPFRHFSSLALACNHVALQASSQLACAPERATRQEALRHRILCRRKLPSVIDRCLLLSLPLNTRTDPGAHSVCIRTVDIEVFQPVFLPLHISWTHSRIYHRLNSSEPTRAYTQASRILAYVSMHCTASALLGSLILC